MGIYVRNTTDLPLPRGGGPSSLEKRRTPFSRELGVGATGNPRSDDIQNGMRAPYAAATNSATMQSKLTPNTAERNIGRSLI